MAPEKIKRINLRQDEKPGYVTYGLVSPEPAYKLALALNATREFSFRIDTPVTPAVSRSEPGFVFPRFSDLSAIPLTWATLMANRSENQFLIRKPANVDFLLIFEPETREPGFPEEILSELRTDGIITAFFLIENENIDTGLLDQIIPHF